MIKHVLLAIATLTLTACFGFFEKDNTEQPAALTNYKAEITPQQRWSTRIGSGASDEYLRLSPSIANNTIFTSSVNGNVVATDASNGHTRWNMNTRMPVTSGPGVGNGLVVVGSRLGDVIALSQTDGHRLWQTNISGEVIAKPAIQNNIVIVKAVNGDIHALSTVDGHEVWAYQQTEPSLILRGSSSPLISGNAVFIGFANGVLSKLSVNSGQLDWSRPIATATGAFSIQRMIDINADPLIYQHRVLAATYQGNIASLDWATGDTLWTHDISSYTGMTTDGNTVYISDANGFLWAFGVDNGLVNWHQTNLKARGVSGPANMNQYIVVGDAEGYLHWLSKRDGHFAARTQVGKSILATPIVDNNILYVLTSDGLLAAYTLSAS